MPSPCEISNHTFSFQLLTIMLRPKSHRKVHLLSISINMLRAKMMFPIYQVPTHPRLTNLCRRGLLWRIMMSNLPLMLEFPCCHEHTGHDVSIHDDDLRLRSIRISQRATGFSRLLVIDIHLIIQ